MFNRKPVDASQRCRSKAVYGCSGCGQLLFAGTAQFDSGTGYPSFWEHLHDHVKQQPLSTYGRSRIQLVCAKCGQHLGHLFPDSRTPTSVRYCINAQSICLTGPESGNCNSSAEVNL